VEAVVETLSMVGSRGETLAEVAHDARNMVTALGLYCDLLEEPGVLASPFSHYASELRLVAGASRRLVEKLVALDAHAAATTELPAIEEEPEEWPSSFHNGLQTRRSASRTVEASGIDPYAAGHIRNLAAELLANRNLLAALAGPSVALTVETQGGALPVRMTAEDLTRILVNLVKNAAEAMDGKGRIQIALVEQSATSGVPERLTLSIEDNGPGIPEKALEKIFESGYTTNKSISGRSAWTTTHRGLGLAITRSILEAAGGRIIAAHRATRGAKLEIELPVGSVR
jgi:signal transduction histidine kinase